MDFTNAHFDQHNMSLATAMVDRRLKEVERQLPNPNDGLAMQIVPGEILPDELMREMRIGVIALLLTALDEPERKIDPAAVGPMMLGDSAYRSMAEWAAIDLEPGEEPLSPEEMEEFIGESKHQINNMISLLWSQINSEGQAEREYVESARIARQIAAERSVTAEDVYLDDALYCELMRRSHAGPDEYVGKNLRLINSAAAVTFQMDGMIDALTAGSDMSEEEREHIRQEVRAMLDHPAYKQALEQQKAEGELRAKRMVLSDLKRFWGDDVLDRLQPETRAALNVPEPTGQSKPEYLQQAQKRSDIVKLYCMQMGWNYKNLTIPQLTEINNSQMMRDFLSRDD